MAYAAAEARIICTLPLDDETLARLLCVTFVDAGPRAFAMMSDGLLFFLGRGFLHWQRQSTGTGYVESGVAE